MVCRFVLVGTGAISSAYIQVCANLKNAVIVAVVSRSGTSPPTLNVPIFPNVSSVSEGGVEYDAIIIGTPNGTHSDLIVEAANLGKHCLVEKPLDITPMACDRIEQAVLHHQIYVGVTYQRRFSPDNIAIKHLLETGVLGRIIGADLTAKFYRDQAYYDQAEYRGNYSMDGGGPFIQQAVHNVDIMCWFFGMPSHVQSMLGTFNHDMEAEDHGVALLRYPDGMIATMIASTCAYPGHPARLEITTEKGSFTLVNDAITEWHVQGVKNPTTTEAAHFQVHAGAKSAKVSDVSGHSSVVQDFIQALEEQRPPTITAQSARMATDVICQIYKVNATHHTTTTTTTRTATATATATRTATATATVPWVLSCFADEAADDLDAQILAVLQGGMSCIDLRNVNNKNVVDLTMQEARVVRAKLDRAGIRVNMLGSPIGKCSLDVDPQVDVVKLQKLAVVGNVVGCNRVRIFSYYNATAQDGGGGGGGEQGGPLTSEDWRKASLQRLQNLKAEANKLGMVLFLENEGGLYGDTVEHVLSLFQVLRDDNTNDNAPQIFGSIFDFDNYLQVGEDCWQAWLQLRECTDAFHLKESRKVRAAVKEGEDSAQESYEHVPLGTGDVEARKILQNAKTIGFRGALSLEPHLTHSPAVMETGPHGSGNQSLAELGPAGTFQVAADAAIALLSTLFL